MRTRTAPVVALLLAATPWGFAGPLAPPAGPVAPTHKTLTDIEPRTAINATNTPGDATHIYRIDQPGSYYLASNITGVVGKGGIIIAAPNVTLDLMGFTLDGAGAGFIGIDLEAAAQDCVIQNGHVINWPSWGIAADLTTHTRIEGIEVSSTGAQGILINNGVVRGCRAHNCGDAGIEAVFRSTIEDCHAELNSGGGFIVGNDCIVRDCHAVTNFAPGFRLEGDRATISGCTASGHLTAGVLVEGDDNTVESNSFKGNVGGLSVSGAGNTIRGNHVNANADNYDFAAGNKLELLLSEIPESIDWPASVTLEGTLTGEAGANGIDITALHVTIDLNGHALDGSAGGLTAINAGSYTTIKNGVIDAWDTAGIIATTGPVTIENVQVSTINGEGIGIDSQAIVKDCHIRATGLAGPTIPGLRVGHSSIVTDCILIANGAGIKTGDRSNISRCTATGNAGYGIEAGNDCVVEACTATVNDAGISAAGRSIVRRCAASQNNTNGIDAGNGCIVEACIASSNGADGIAAGTSTDVIGCTAAGNADGGIVVGDQGTVRACRADSNTGRGIEAAGHCLIADNRCHNNALGIQITGSHSKIDGNMISNNPVFELEAFGEDNLIVRNTFSSVSGSFNFGANNLNGPFIFISGSGDISGETGSDHPMANFHH